MSNSEYEDREMEYLIESGTEGEQGEKPDITEEDQEENLKSTTAKDLILKYIRQKYGKHG